MDRELLRRRFTASLQQALLEGNLSVADLARSTGIPYRTLHDWAEGNACPHLGDPRREVLANALGRSLAWMNGLDEEATDDANRAADE